MPGSLWIVAFGAAALTGVAEELPFDADDECAASSEVDGEGCGLSAIQLRGQKIAESNVGSVYLERTLVADEGQQLAARDSMSVASCGALCDKVGGCHSFTFGYSGSNSGKCFLKSAVVNSYSSDSGNSWSKQNFKTYYKPPQVRGYVARTLVANEGGALNEFHDSTPDACAGHCDNTAGCQSFSFSFGGNDKHTCYLKSKSIAMTDSATTNPWNLEHYATYFKASSRPDASGPDWKHSSTFKHRKSCTPGELITSVEFCKQAAKDMGIKDSLPRIVPMELSTLPPGCFYGKAVGTLSSGMFFNSYGLAYFKPELNKEVTTEPGYELLCKRHPFEMKRGATCGDGKAIASMGECQEAAKSLNMNAPREVPSSAGYSLPKGCFQGKVDDPNTYGSQNAVWYNGAFMTTYQPSSYPTENFLCRIEAPTR